MNETFRIFGIKIENPSQTLEHNTAQQTKQCKHIDANTYKTISINLSMNYIWHMRLSYTWCTSQCFLLLLLLLLTFWVCFFHSLCVALFSITTTPIIMNALPPLVSLDPFTHRSVWCCLYDVDFPKSTKFFLFNLVISFVFNHHMNE